MSTKEQNTGDNTEQNAFKDGLDAKDEVKGAGKGKRLGVFSKSNQVLFVIIIAMFVLSYLVKTFFVTNITIVGGSMMPTYNNGEVVWISKIDTPSPGDVVVLYSDDDKKTKVIKRVVAVGGDTVEMTTDDDDYILIVTRADGQRCLYDCAGYRGTMELDSPRLLDEQDLFILGDNRNNSRDSRMDQYTLDDLVGVVLNARQNEE